MLANSLPAAAPNLGLTMNRRNEWELDRGRRDALWTGGGIPFLL
jgi:hypothetical protein